MMDNRSVDANIVLICKKCKEKGDYLIPIISLNKVDNKITFKCLKCDSDNINDFYEIFINDKLKKSLNICKIHEGQFSGWCNECKKNLCYLCIAEEIKKNHNYILNDIIEEKEYIINSQEYIKAMKSHEIFNRKYEHQIYCYELSVNIYNTLKITNFQASKNLHTFASKIIKYYEEYKKYMKKEYNDFLSFIKGKDIEEIQKETIAIGNIKDTIIFPISCKFSEQSSFVFKKFIIIYKLYSDILQIYDINGTFIKSKELSKYIPTLKTDLSLPYDNKCIIIQYKSDVLLFCKNQQIVFLSFNSSFNECKFSNEMDLKITIYKSDYNCRTYTRYLSFFYENKIIKLNDNAIIFNFFGKLIQIDFIEHIFAKKDNDDKDKLFKRIIDDNIIKIIPIYDFNCNKSLKEIIGAQLDFDYYDIPKDNKNLSTIYYTYFYNNEYIMEIFPYEKMDEQIKQLLLNNTNFYLRIKRYNCMYNLNEKETFKINISKSDIMKWLNKSSYFNMVYSYSTNTLLLFFYNKIYQYNLINHEIFAINEIGSPDIIFNNLSVIHYFKGDLTKMKELFLVRDSLNKIYPYCWEYKEFKSIPKFYLQKYNSIIEFDITKLYDENLLDSMNLERLSINGNIITIFK